MEMINEKVKELIDSEKFEPIKQDSKRLVTEQLLKNEIKYLEDIRESSVGSTTQTAGVSNWDPILIRMVRRGSPMLMAFDLAGVQPMAGPTGLIFAMRSRYANQTGAEAMFDEANSAFSGAGTMAGDTSGFPADYFGSNDPDVSTATGVGTTTGVAESLGTDGNSEWNEMTFTIEKLDVSAKSRKLKASFSSELRQDLKAVHGLDAESELANFLVQEINAEQNRELLRTINISAKIGAQKAAIPGLFDLAADSDGRWLVEKFKGLLFQVELEANSIMKSTRRGKGNRIICSANVASALAMAGVLDQGGPTALVNLNVDETSSTYAGILLNRYAVHIDPYADRDYITVGYKGANAWDAGIYWAPYVPLEMVRAVAEDSFHPRIGFQTRYGIKANPFSARLSNGSLKAGEGLGQGESDYFVKFAVANLQG